MIWSSLSGSQLTLVSFSQYKAHQHRRWWNSLTPGHRPERCELATHWSLVNRRVIWL